MEEEKKKKAGRPVGSKSAGNIMKLRRFVSIREIERFVELAKKQAEDKPEILKFVLEQIFGRAPQSVDMTVTPGLQFKAMEDKLRLLSQNDVKQTLIADPRIGPDAVQDGDWAGVDTDTDAGDSVQHDMAEGEPSEPCDVPHEVREELRDSVGGPDSDSDVPGEVGDSSPE